MTFSKSEYKITYFDFSVFGLIVFKPPYSSSHISTVLRLYEEHRLSALEEEDATAISKQVAFEWCRNASILRSKSEADRIQNGRRNGKDYELLGLYAVVLSVAGSKSDHDIAKEIGVARRFVSDSRIRYRVEIDSVMMSRVRTAITHDAVVETTLANNSAPLYSENRDLPRFAI